MRGRAAGLLLVATTLLASACSSSGTLNDAGSAGASTTAVTSPTTTSPVGATWSTYHHDSGRSGVDPTSPAAGPLTRAWRQRLDGAVYAEPLVVGTTTYVATENDTVYALDAATGAVRWSRHLGSPVAGSSLPCGDIDPSGITGTPVIDQTTATLWVVAFEKPGRHVLYGLALSDGAIRSSRFADPSGSDPSVEQERGALTLSGSTVYVPYGGLYGDCGDYHGWVMGFSESRSGAVHSWKVPNALQAGIWAPPGLTVGRDGSLFASTGNGQSTDAFHDSDAVVRLSPTLAVLDAFAPSNWRALDDGDLDLGTTSPAVLASGLVLQVGKQGVGYLVRGDHLGGVGGELFSRQVCSSAFGGTAIVGSTVYVSCRDGLREVRVTSGPQPGFTVEGTGGDAIGPPIVAGGVVWAVTTDGHLVGFDQVTGRQRYRLAIGSVVTSFPSLAASQGRLYVPAGAAIVCYRGA